MAKNNKMPAIRFSGYTDAWEQRKLGEVVKSYSGGTPTASNKEYYGGDIPFIRSAEINSDTTELYITQKGLDNSSAKIVEKGTILYAMYGATSGEVGISKINGAINQAILAMIPLNYDGKIIAQYLRKNKESIIGKYLQGGQGNLSANIILELPIQLPGLEESNQIAYFLESVDNIITLHQRKLEKLKLTKKALLQKLFPKNGSNIPELRFKGFTDAWEQRKLSELATMNARIGWQNLRTSEFLDSGDYLLITGTDFDNGRIKYNTCHYVEKKRFDQDTKIQLSTGSILITKDGTLGKVALVEELPKPATLNAGVFNVRVKDDAVLSYKYLYHYLKAPFLMKYVTANATGGTIKHLNQSILVDFPIPITEKQEQDRIAKLLDSLESIITLHQRKLEMLKNVKKGLLQKMFV